MMLLTKAENDSARQIKKPYGSIHLNQHHRPADKPYGRTQMIILAEVKISIIHLETTLCDCPACIYEACF